nr:hypothetical protein [uncultured Rhodopila sp.]
MAESDDEGRELRDRLTRLEVLTTLALLASSENLDEGTLYDLRRYIRRRGRLEQDKSTFDLEFLIDRIGFRGAPKLAEVREELSSLRDSQTRSNQKIESGLSELRSYATNTSAKLDTVDFALKALSSSTHEWLSFQSLGLASSGVKLSRFLPLRVYLSEASGTAVESVSQAIKGLLDAFGLEFADEFPAIYGSWFKKWFAKTSEAMTQPEVAVRLKKLERAVEMRGLGQLQAEIDERQAAAAAQLIGALKDTPVAAVQVGSILIIKLPSANGPMTQVRTLTQAELMQLENNQALLTSPESLLQRLSDACRSASGSGYTNEDEFATFGYQNKNSSNSEDHQSNLAKSTDREKTRRTGDDYLRLKHDPMGDAGQAERL